MFAKLPVKDHLVDSLHYLSFFLSLVIVYGISFVLNYLLYQTAEMLLVTDLPAESITVRWFHHVKLGLAVVFTALAAIHIAMSTIWQIKHGTITREKGEAG